MLTGGSGKASCKRSASDTNVKGFQFLEGKPQAPQVARAGDKENKSETGQPASKKRPSQDNQPASQQDDSRSPTKPFPSTPATRLPLSDLLGNVDDRYGNEATDISPEEQITWHTIRSPRSSGSKKTPAPRQKKRVRSSSPPTTSQHKSARKDALNLDSLKTNLKTPKIDPAADLWNRVATNTDKERLSGFNPTSLANIACPSSPYSASDQGGNIGGLRRWTSCGMEWPSSKAKRRKVNHTSSIREQVDEAIHEASEADESGNMKPSKSKITSLIERLQGNVHRPTEQQEPPPPSSSSPLPEGRDSLSQRQQDPSSPSKQPGPGGLPPMEDTKRSPIMAADEPSSSSFGSDAGSLTMLDTVAGADPVKQEDPIPKPLNDGHPSQHEAPIAPVVLDDNEFDDDIDVEGDEFDAVTSLCDRRPPAPSIPPPKEVVDLTEPGKDNILADDFDDHDFDDDAFAAAELAATQSAGGEGSKETHSTPNKRIIQRYLVQNVFDGSYTDANGRECPEKMLLVEDDKTKLNRIIILRQSWIDTRCTTGSYVHIIGEFDRGGQCVVDDAHNILILHPDHLISALVVADSFTCMRKSVLQDRIKATSEASAPMAYGTMLHEIFQEAMQANRWDSGWLRETIEKVVARHIEDLYEIKLTVEQATEHLLSKMPGLQSWAEVFVRASPQSHAIVKDRNGKELTMSVNKLLDVEEHVWSPMYGLKGNIDASIQVIMQDEQGERTLTVPFEVKTGKNSSNASHRAQTALYTLLLSDRYDVAVAYGILYYLETSEISRIPAIRHELLHMIMQRNELACYVRERLSLPPMIRNTHQCNRCYAKTPCFIYHKLVEDGDGETSGLREKFDAVVRDLTPKDQEFFKKWDELLTKEESEMMKFKRELWTMLSEEREKHGRCFAKVVLDQDTASEEPNGSKINRFRYTFRKHNEELPFTFNESHISVGEPIVVSDEKEHYALALGYVVNLGKRHITVAVDRRLRNARVRQPGFDIDINQIFKGVMDISKRSTQEVSQSTSSNADPVVYRLDKDEFSNGLASVRNNLIQIMTNETFHARDLRRQIVEGVEPRFKPAATSYDLSGPLSQLSINDDQREAIEKIMSAEDYALVLGMPGTGKTTTIAHLIRALVAKGKSVLLTSYTHTAVDNILLKLKQDKIGVLRLGAAAKVHPEVRDFAKLGAEPGTTIEELERLYQDPQVVATTCLGINHQVFKERTFDYCIVDEASQITLPVCLGPIRMAKTFVLVGDHYQLPPLVQNKEALQGGLDISLFRLLSERHPDAVTTLRTQYRMNEAVMSVSNELIYDGRLVCGSEEVAKKTLEMPNFDALAQLHFSGSSAKSTSCTSHSSTSCWLHGILHADSPSVVFLNTDTLLPGPREIAHGARITNPFEATLATQLIQALLLTGLDPSSIGLTTLYRSHLALIKSTLQGCITPAQAELLEAHTTDRFQGRDKDVIILSCVRSNERDIVGDLLKDWRRVNVALTRAKKKLIIIGSKGTLSRGDALLGKLVKLCEDKSWMIDLPASAADETSHSWPVISASVSTANGSGKPAASATVSINSDQAVSSNPAMPQPYRPNRQPLQSWKSNVNAGNVNKAFKVPTKTGKVTAGAVLGSGSGNVKDKRPILTDIFNDITGGAPWS